MSLILSLQFCEVITVSWLKHLSAQVVRIMLDYTDHVSFCSKLKDTLEEQKQWPEICHIQSKSSPDPAALNDSLSPFVVDLFALCLTRRKRSEPEAPVSVADKGASQSPALEGPTFHQLPSSSSPAERLLTLQGV